MLKGHKENCQCGVCKMKRGEMTGKNNPRGMSGKENKWGHHTQSSIAKIRLKSLEQFKNGMPEETIVKMRKSMIGKNAGEKNGMYGKKPGNFIDGLIKRGDRYFVWMNGKRIRYARYVAEQCLQRKLTKEEIVHHINEEPSDDRPENLYLFANQSEHMRHHGWKIKPILISNI